MSTQWEIISKIRYLKTLKNSNGKEIISYRKKDLDQDKMKELIENIRLLGYEEEISEELQKVSYFFELDETISLVFESDDDNFFQIIVQKVLGDKAIIKYESDKTIILFPTGEEQIVDNNLVEFDKYGKPSIPTECSQQLLLRLIGYIREEWVAQYFEQNNFVEKYSDLFLSIGYDNYEIPAMTTEKLHEITRGKFTHMSSVPLTKKDLRDGLDKERNKEIRWKMEAFWFAWEDEWIIKYPMMYEADLVHEVVINPDSFVTMKDIPGKDKILLIGIEDLNDFKKKYTKQSGMNLDKKALESNYGGLYFPDYKGMGDWWKYSNQYWYRLLEVSSGSIWNSSEIIKEIKLLGKIVQNEDTGVVDILS